MGLLRWVAACVGQSVGVLGWLAACVRVPVGLLGLMAACVGVPVASGADGRLRGAVRRGPGVRGRRVGQSVGFLGRVAACVGVPVGLWRAACVGQPIGLLERWVAACVGVPVGLWRAACVGQPVGVLERWVAACVGVPVGLWRAACVGQPIGLLRQRPGHCRARSPPRGCNSQEQPQSLVDGLHLEFGEMAKGAPHPSLVNGPHLVHHGVGGCTQSTWTGCRIGYSVPCPGFPVTGITATVGNRGSSTTSEGSRSRRGAGCGVPARWSVRARPGPGSLVAGSL